MEVWKLGDKIEVNLSTYKVVKVCHPKVEIQVDRGGYTQILNVEVGQPSVMIEHESGQLKSYSQQANFEKEGFKKVN